MNVLIRLLVYIITVMNLYGCNLGQPISGDDVSDKNNSIGTISKSALNVDNNLSANIITSAISPVINPADGSTTVTVNILNNGTAAANSVVVSGLTPLLIQNNTCNATIIPNQTCSFKINVESTVTVSGQSSVLISFNDGINTKIVPLNVSYITTTPSPLIDLSALGSFNSIPINQGPVFITVKIQNTGSAKLYNLTFNDINLANSAMSSFALGSTCVSGQDLDINDSCYIVLSYSPTVIQSGSVTLVATANYKSQNGNALTYINSNLTIPYLSVSGAIFKAVGDFGVVFTSPAGAGGTWSANIDSPFALATVSANSMVINNGTYIMSMSNGGIKYSTSNGLFWQTTVLGGGATMNASSCSVVYDGTYYYSCGVMNTTFATVCTVANRGCVVRTNNLTSGWIPLFTPSQTVAINDITYFTNGANNAYVATIANTAANTGLATSTNGSTWVATSSGQATIGNNNFTPVAFNPANNSLTAWNSVGWSSTEPLSTVGTSWVANTTTRPANNRVTSALFQDCYYTLALANGNIYTATTPTTAYTQRSTNAVQLNKIVYAAAIGSGTYLAVGNSGVNLTAVNPLGTWSSQTPLVVGQSTNPNLTGAYYNATNNSLWVSGVNAILTSNNATSWKIPGLQSITKNGSTYLAVDNQGYIYSSINGVSWSTQVNPSGNILNSIYCVSQNFCFAVGNKGTILKTTDGINWVVITSGTSNNLNSIVCQEGSCVIIGGAGTANSGTILFSNDYANWSVITSRLATTNLNQVAVYNNRYFTVGNAGSVFSSTNGKDWSSMTSGTAVNLNAITCGSNLGCIAVGNGGVIIYSAFGISWVAGTSGTTNDLLSAAYDAIFVVVGKSGVIKFSNNGTTWTNATFPASSATLNLNAVISE